MPSTGRYVVIAREQLDGLVTAARALVDAVDAGDDCYEAKREVEGIRAALAALDD